MTDRILIVDDEAAIRYALREYFGVVGYEVDCAATVAEAIAALDGGAYVAVISDLQFGYPYAQPGLEVVRSARTRQPNSWIVVLTAYGSPEIAAEALRSGADEFLDKPVPLPQLARMLLEGSKTRQHGPSSR